MVCHFVILTEIWGKQNKIMMTQPSRKHELAATWIHMKWIYYDLQCWLRSVVFIRLMDLEMFVMVMSFKPQDMSFHEILRVRTRGCCRLWLYSEAEYQNDLLKFSLCGWTWFWPFDLCKFFSHLAEKQNLVSCLIRQHFKVLLFQKICNFIVLPHTIPSFGQILS